MIWLIGDLKDLNRRTTADKILRDKAFYIVKDPKYDGYQQGLATCFIDLYIFWYKKVWQWY